MVKTLLQHSREVGKTPLATMAAELGLNVKNGKKSGSVTRY